MNADVAPVCFTAEETLVGFVKSDVTLSNPPDVSSAALSPGISLVMSRMARKTLAPLFWAVRATKEPTLPVGPKTIVRAAIFREILTRVSF